MDQPLDIPTLPLFGRRLIEASAGTGKTFTIAALYVRLVLGHGGNSAFQRALMPNEILVVTFTRAATEELRERIRSRLREARDVLLRRAVPDPVLESLLADVVDDDMAARQARQLDNAVRMMDDAAIFTIHGFCQRMLKRHAFDSGSRFEVELTSEGDTLFDQAVEDYWRRHYYPLDERTQILIATFFSSPAKLADALRLPYNADTEGKLMDGARMVTVPASVSDALSPFLSSYAGLGRLAQQIRSRCPFDEVRTSLLDALQSGVFKANIINAEKMNKRLEALELWYRSDTSMLPVGELIDNKKRVLLGSEYLHSALKAGKAAPAHAAFDLLDQLGHAQLDLPDPRMGLIAHALHTVGADIMATKRRHSVLDFNDLLAELDRALRGPMGERLARSIRRELPVALIDEFQDTDARQYRIFEHIYPLQMHAPFDTYDTSEQDGSGDRPNEYQSHALLLIGDPKQAIYAFRNADLATYMEARNSVQARYSLGRNHRSSVAMVTAINQLFSLNPTAFLEEGLIFEPSDAQGRSDRFMNKGNVEPALTWWLPESSLSMSGEEYMRTMSDAVRADIQNLLEGSGRRDVGFSSEEGELQPLRASDIAVLVRTGTEAIAVREALALGGIRSVYLSQKASVFTAHEAFWLLQLLEAVAQPRRDRLLRAALATRMLGDGLRAVERLALDEHYWEMMVERFEKYHYDWRRHGVLAMLRRVMHDFDVAARLLASEGGERSLTNLLHLAELAQSASQMLDGEQALLRWLHRALDGRFDQGVDPESLVQRLESDESLVRIVTIHKSKGLEYPLVYVPFACNYREVNKGKVEALVVRHPEYGRVAVLDPDQEQRDLADRARLAEDVRLLYVALTRARYACRVGMAPLFKGNKGQKSPEDMTTLDKSAVGYLLGNGDKVSGNELRRLLGSLVNPECVAVCNPPELPDHSIVLSEHQIPLRQGRVFKGNIDTGWWIASYSAITENAQIRRDSRDSDVLASSFIDLEVAAEQTPVPAPPLGRINDFPRGPRAGTFLHGVLESVDFDRLDDEDYSVELRHMIDVRLERSSFDDAWGEVLHKWLLQVLNIPLSASSEVCLNHLGAWRSELEFWLPIGMVRAPQIDYLIRRHEPLLPVEEYPVLAPRALQGMLRGFIDLVFEIEGRWYLIDWKSNHLGDVGEDYGGDRVVKAMIEHRYDVQYVLYTLALHRLLSVRLADYDYDRDIGGVFYLFLRGIDEKRIGQGVFHRRPSRALIEALGQMFTGNVESNSPDGQGGDDHGS